MKVLLCPNVLRDTDLAVTKQVESFIEKITSLSTTTFLPNSILICVAESFVAGFHALLGHFPGPPRFTLNPSITFLPAN